MVKEILQFIENAKRNNQKLLALLLDPDKISVEDIDKKISIINSKKIDLIFVGGSLLFTNVMDEFIIKLKEVTTKPILLFPGSAMQISKYADGILFLQLISGRNPEYLISNQIIAAPLLKQTSLEVIPTSYILVESGRETTASYISNTKPIPSHKPEIAMATALAGQYLGQRLLYMDAGSGALHPIPTEMIELVSKNIDIPMIIGGGIRTKIQLDNAYNAGATLVVIGTAFEEDASLLEKF